MATYAIYVKTHVEDAVFVREGFSLSACVFTFAWALWHRMWIVGLIAFSFLLLASLLPAGMDFLTSVSIAIVFGVFGSDLREWSLLRHGFAQADLVEADDLETAELQFYTTAPVSAPRAQLASADMLGLFGTP